MPRVNRDLQRRMAARRDRERRRPSGERRYRFDGTEPSAESDMTLVEEDVVAEEEAVEVPSRPARSGRDTSAAAAGSAVANRSAPRAASKPFTAYREEYAYVYSDLRRVAAVIGSLLVILIVLYFVMPLVTR